MSEQRTVSIDDIVKAGFCVRGARRWFAEHGLDFRAMLKDGVPEEELLRSGDSLAEIVVTRKREREASDGR